MTSVIRNIRAVIGEKIKLLYTPILLAVLDAFLNMLFYSVMILSIVTLIKNQFTESFFFRGIAVLAVVFIFRTLLASWIKLRLL